MAVSALAFSACNSNTTAAAVQPAPTATPAGTPTLAPPGTPTNIPAMTLTSTSFVNAGNLPTASALSGCGGTNISPDLSWSGAPATTQSFVLTEFDTDAPTGVGFWHWTLFNIPPTVTSLASNAGANPPPGAIAGYNDYGASGYGGPCPPVADIPHHYYFTISALNTAMLAGLSASSTGAFLTFNMRGHILAQGQLLGRYGR